MRIRHWIGCLLALGGLAGCAANTDGATPVARTHPEPAVSAGAEVTPEEHLARLEALSLFEVGELIERMPEESMQCYGPCPRWVALTPEQQQAEIATLRDAQEARLADLVAIAEDVHSREALPPVDTTTNDAHRAALAALQIVEVGALVVTEPVSSPSCYGVPCPGDTQRADADNARRAAELAALADEAQGL